MQNSLILPGILQRLTYTLKALTYTEILKPRINKSFTVSPVNKIYSYLSFSTQGYFNIVLLWRYDQHLLLKVCLQERNKISEIWEYFSFSS